MLLWVVVKRTQLTKLVSERNQGANISTIDTWRDLQRQWRERPPLEVSLKDYDALLDSWEEDGQEEPSQPQEVAV